MIISNELCPNCWRDSECYSPEGRLYARCEHCGKWIVLCNLCEEQSGCNTCKWVQKCKELNEKEELCTK